MKSKRKLRICFIFDYPHFHGGVWRVVGLGKEFLKNGHKIDLIGVTFDRRVPFWKYRISEEEEAGIRITKFSANHLIPFLFFQLIFLSKYLRKNRIDVLQSYNPSYLTCLIPLVLRMFMKVKWVIQYDDIAVIRDYEQLGFLELNCLKLLEKIIIRYSDIIIVLTEYQKNYLEGRGLSPDKIEHIPNFIDVPHIESSVKDPSMIRGKYSLRGKIVLGYVGSVHHQMGLEDMINVLPFLRKKIKNICLLIVGDGGALEHLKNLAIKDNADDLVLFTGRVPNQDVGEYYSTMDILLSPLKDTPSNLAVDHMKIYEYMATGKPVIAASVGSIKDVIKDGKNGMLYSSGDLEEFSQKILFLISDEARVKKIGVEGKRTVQENHNINRIGKLWEEMYLKLIEE